MTPNEKERPLVKLHPSVGAQNLQKRPRFLSFMTHAQKIILVLALLCAILGAEKYTSKWDNLDIEQILHSSRLLENYKKCLMGEGSCTPEGSELKSHLEDALQTECSKCTPKQKSNAEKIINYMIENKQEWWEELEKKFDPTGIYYKRYLQRRSKSKEQKLEMKNSGSGT